MEGRGIRATARLGRASGHQDPGLVPAHTHPQGRHLKVLGEEGGEQVAGHGKQKPRVPAQCLVLRLYPVNPTSEQLVVRSTAH